CKIEVYDDSSAPVTVTGATFTGGLGYEYGGFVGLSGTGSLTITGSDFSSTSSYLGGAIYTDATGDLTVTGSTFTGDGAYYGGAVEAEDDTAVTLTSDDFTGDSASYAGYGGAVYADGVTTLDLSNDQFSGDPASYYGGAVYAETVGTFTDGGSSYTGNESYDGGALWLDDLTGATLTNDTIAQNAAVYGGGIGLESSMPLALVNDTIADNSAYPTYGGGIYGASEATVPSSGPGVVNTVIADNTGGDCNSTFASSEVTGYDLDSDSSCFDRLSAPGLKAGVQPSLAAPANNGGTVLTMREQSGSPTIGTGLASDCPSTDARGVSRSGSCDMGAYQAAQAGLSASVAQPTSVATGAEFPITVTGTNNGPAPATDTTIAMQLPAGLTLAGSDPSSGSCTVTGATVSCDLGTVAAGSSGTVVLLVSDKSAGSITDTATVTDDQGASVSAAATTAVGAAATMVVGAAGKPRISALRTSGLKLHRVVLHVRVTTVRGPATYFVQYGTTKAFGHLTRIRVLDRTRTVSVVLGHLAAGTRYYVRMVATSGGLVTYSRVRVLRTKGSAR
ncbi:MAG: choice-of-anchor Q domain-containing protein, partial [Solirubrobacteraceae bacterium]